ncbi:hypothetical protein BKA61DRAFT_675998 [Leptodontidium sp. MPI-SDFR-AT-0119]|nr:hypothetical protein BKA61DRAFT_675998 [Leptodontidium sp. MPI-SDFR-AT-0119]
MSTSSSTSQTSIREYSSFAYLNIGFGLCVLILALVGVSLREPRREKVRKQALEDSLEERENEASLPPGARTSRRRQRDVQSPTLDLNVR